MAALDDVAITLRFRGDDLVPEDITAALGVTPNWQARKGDVTTFRTGRIRTERSGAWCFSPERAVEDLETQLLKMLDQLNRDLAVWRQITSRFDANVFIGAFLAGKNEGFELSAATLSALSARGLALHVDVYGPDEDEESTTLPPPATQKPEKQEKRP